MTKKQLINIIKNQDKKIERLQIKICNGEHDYVMTSQKTKFNTITYNYSIVRKYRCSRCELVKTEEE